MEEPDDGQHGLSARGWDNVGAIMPKIKAAVADRESTANTLIDLGTAENWLLRSELIEICKTAIQGELVAQYFSYPKAFAGFPSVLDALVKFFNNYFHPHTAVQTSHLACAPGAASCLDTLFYNICDPGDAILLAGPYWSGFDFQLKARSSVIGIPVVANSLQECVSDAIISALEGAFEQAKQPVRALLVTNPHNPFAQCYPRPVLEECIKFCTRRDIHYISDEVYAMTSFSAQDNSDLPSFVSALSIDVRGLGCDPSRVHVVWSPSKDFGQSGTRIGCTVTQFNPEMAVGLALASNTTTSSLSAIFLTTLLTSDKLPNLIDLNSQRLGDAYASLTEVLRQHQIQYLPANAGVYLFARIAPHAKCWDDEAAAVRDFRDAGIIVSSGKGYHGPSREMGWARIGFAVEQDAMKEALKRIDNALRGKT